MTFILLAVLAVFLVLAFGVLIGNGYTTHSQDARDRRQAAMQRDLNLQYRVLRENKEPGEEEMR